MIIRPSFILQTSLELCLMAGRDGVEDSSVNAILINFPTRFSVDIYKLS